MQRKGNVIWMYNAFQMKFIPVCSLSVLHSSYEVEIVNRIINVFMLVIDVLISIFESV